MNKVFIRLTGLSADWTFFDSKQKNCLVAFTLTDLSAIYDFFLRSTLDVRYGTLARIVKEKSLKRAKNKKESDLSHSHFLCSVSCYFVILVTTPAPTVLPPSRIAKRRP